MRAIPVAVAVVLTMAWTASLVAQESGDLTLSVRPVAVRTVSADFPTDAFDFKPFHASDASTSVALLVECTGRSIVSIDADQSRIESFRDDAGHDLSQPAEGDAAARGVMRRFGRQSMFGSFPQISDSHDKAIIEINAPAPPAKGARTLQVRGTLALEVARGTTTVSTESVALEPGPLAVEGHQIAITGIEPHAWGDDARNEIRLTLRGPTAQRLASIHFSDAQGNEVESQRIGTMTMMNHVDVQYLLPRSLQQATIHIHFWDGLETVQAPLELTVGLGL